MRIYLILLLLITAVVVSIGQTVALDKICLEYLGERANSLKVKTYAVRVDEMEGSVIVLKKERRSVKGVLFFPKQKKALMMSGTDALLYLRDEQGFDHGKLNYSTNNESFNGVLLSGLGHKMAQIKGPYTKDVPVIPPACYVDKWLTYHKGSFGEEPIHMFLQRIGNGDLQGLLYFSKKKKSVFLSGIMIGGKIDLFAVDAAGIKVGDILLKQAVDGALTGAFSTKDTKEKIKTVPVLSDRQNCFSEISTDFRYSIIYPKLGIPEFDDQMNRFSIEWINKCKAEVKKLNQPILKRTLLNGPSAYSYVRVHCRDFRYFSGYQIDFLPVANTYQIKSINFDLKKKLFLSMEDVFSSPTQLKGMVKVKALKLLAVHRLKRYSGFAEWMSKANFDNFVIQPEGILFSSSFDPVFGQQHVLLTYKELKPYLKNKNIYKHFRKFK